MSFGFGLAFPHWQILSGGAFSPASLFAAGEQGAWYDPSDFLRYMSEGPELITNGGFSNGTTGWSASGGTASSVNGNGRITTTGATVGYLSQSFATVVGNTYLFRGSITGRNGGSFIGLRKADDAFASVNANVFINTLGNVTQTFVATATTTFIVAQVNGSGAGDFVEVDNISVCELTAISTATLFQDSAGTTPVTAVEQPVGLMLDKSKGLVLGSELATVTSWVSASGYQNVTITNALVSGKFYQISFLVTSTNNGGLEIRVGDTSGSGTDVIISNVAARQYQYILPCDSGGTGVLFQDTTGTAFAGTITNISVRELPGNHATQSSTTKRPTLSARYNLLTRTEEFNDAVWVKNLTNISANATTAPTGTSTADKLIATSVNGNHYAASASIVVPANTSVKNVCHFKAAEYGFARLACYNTAITSGFRVDVNLSTGQVVASSTIGTGTVSSATCEALGDGWFRVTVVGVVDAASTQVVQWVQFANSSSIGVFTGDDVSGVFAWGADLRVANDALNQPAYQRVTTATDYDTAGFLPYLRFDGTDDAMATASIDFTATDKMTVFAGVRKLSDANLGWVAELSVDALANNGAFLLYASTAPGYGAGLRGTSQVFGTVSPFTAPVSSVVSTTSNIGAAARNDELGIRVNGAAQTITWDGSSSANVGTGNFGNYPLFIGQRNQASLPFNGRLYSLIVRGAETSAALIAATESWVARETGVSLIPPSIIYELGVYELGVYE